MISTANLNELNKIVQSQHSDPHSVLGIHKIIQKGEECFAIRAFIPNAKKITAIDCSDEKIVWALKKIHVNGFFEAVINNKEDFFKYKLSVEYINGESKIGFDPYSYFPTLSELDLHLFKEGTHYELYNKLGANPIIVDGVSGVSFATWAPRASVVSVIGDFNEWNNNAHCMRNIPSAGIWEIFIPGIELMSQYKFVIKNANGEVIEKSDPYAKHTSLIPNTSSKVVDISKYRWKDSAFIKQSKKQTDLDIAMNIYELHLGSWKRNENEYYSYSEIAEELLEYVIGMGYTHIQLMPIMEHSYETSLGYEITNYFAPTSRYGEPKDLMIFVDMAHKKNIKILLEWVPAYFSKEYHGLGKFDGQALYENEDYRFLSCFNTNAINFDYSKNQVRNFLISNALFWIEQYHIDGLVVNSVSSMLYLDYGKTAGQWLPNINGGIENYDAIEFIRHLNSIVHLRNPHVCIIADETSLWRGVCEKIENNGLGFDYKINKAFMNNIIKFMSKSTSARKKAYDSLSFPMSYNYDEKFISVLPHELSIVDNSSLIEKMPGDLSAKFSNLKLLYLFVFVHPGKKLLFMGNEFAQITKWNEQKQLDWFLLEYEQNKKFQLFVRDINNLYLNESALNKTDFDKSGFQWIEYNDEEKSIISFMRAYDEKLVIVCNTSNKAFENYLVNIPLSGRFVELINSDDEKYGGTNIGKKEILRSKLNNAKERISQIKINIAPNSVIIYKEKLAGKKDK